MFSIIAAAGNPLDFLSQFGVEWRLLISQGLSFAIVTAALYKFVFKPVIAVSEKRRAAIEQGLRDAEAAKVKLANAQTEAAKQAAEAATEAAKILKDARDDARNAVEKAAAEASAKAAEIRDRNEQQLERDKLKMKEELKSELSELVAKAAEAVAGSVLTDAQRSQLAELAAKELKK